MSDKLALLKIKFAYHDGSVLTITNKSFKEAVATALNKELFKQTPIKVVFPNTKKILYFDDNLFSSYLQNQIEQPELIQLTQCEGLYRNKVKLLTNTHEDIDPGTLWKRNGNTLQLVSTDDSVTSEFIDDLFEEV